MDLNSILCRVGVDTLVYAGVKYGLHSIIDHDMLKAVNPGDIMAFVVADGGYYLLLKRYVAYYFTSYAMFSDLVAKYGTIILTVTLLNLFTGRKDRIIDNLINIGAAGAVTETFHKILGSVVIGGSSAVPTSAPVL